MIPKNIIAALIVRICGGSISFLASACLCYKIWVSPKGLQTPYSRIIFGFSIADILQSVGIILSPFLSPADNPDGIFSKGTVASCEGIGLLFVMGSHAITWYILFLTYYFLKRVKYKQTPHDFAKCEEKCIFVYIWIYAIVTSVYPLIKGEINATRYGSFCMISSRPFQCGSTSDLVKCTRGENAKRSSLYFSAGPIVAIFFLLIVVLGTLICYMYNAEKALQPSSSSRSQVNNQKSNKEEEKESRQTGAPTERDVVPNNCKSCDDSPVNTVSSQHAPQKAEIRLLEQERDEPKQRSIQEEPSSTPPLRSPSVINRSTRHPFSAAASEDNSTRRLHQGMDLTKRAAHQSILYILAFMLVYIGPLLALLLRFSKTKNTSANYWMTSLFYPIGGFLNMLIYTRPKVQGLKELIPDLPIVICFLIVILSGGETPSLADLQMEQRAYVTSSKEETPGIQEKVVHEKPPRPLANSRESSLNYWLDMFGLEKHDDIEAELDKRMRGLFSLYESALQEEGLT